MNTQDFLDAETGKNTVDLPRELTIEETRQIGGGATLVEYVVLMVAC
jgi:hypothetical protein